MTDTETAPSRLPSAYAWFMVILCAVMVAMAFSAVVTIPRYCSRRWPWSLAGHVATLPWRTPSPRSVRAGRGVP